MEELNSMQNYGAEDQLFITTADNVTLTPLQTTVTLIMSETGNFTITLPPAALVRGRHISIYAQDIHASGNTVTIADTTGASRDFPVNDTITADDDHVLLYSDGVRYIWVKDVTT